MVQSGIIMDLNRCACVCVCVCVYNIYIYIYIYIIYIQGGPKVCLQLMQIQICVVL